MDFEFDFHSIHSKFVEHIWYTRSNRPGNFMSAAASNWEMVLTKYQGITRFVVRGPETKASLADFPEDAEFFGITFTLGTFMPHLPIKTVLDRQDVILPSASTNSVWLNSSVWELPTYENADAFIHRLIRQDVLVHDTLVENALKGQPTDISPRALQYRFSQATGISQKLIQQIERARQAMQLLECGTPIIETALELGYFDQAHLTNSLQRFVGKTPTQLLKPPPSP